MKVRFYILGFVSGLVFLSILAGSYFLGKTNPSETNVTPTPSPSAGLNRLNTPDNQVNPASPTPTVPKMTTREAIVSAFKTGNYDLLGHMAVVVNVRIEGTECCGSKTGSGVIDSFQYLEPAEGPWDFSQTNEVALDLESLYPENYGGAIIGVTQDGYAVSFQMNKEGMINNVSMTNNYKVLLP